MLGFLLMFVTIAALMLGFSWAMRTFGLSDSIGSPQAEPALRPADLERLHEAIAALDERLDRLEDQQRFLERLLADRPARALPPGEREGGERRGKDLPAPKRDAEGSDEVDSILFDTDHDSS